jgi:hypothetical protein
MKRVLSFVVVLGVTLAVYGQVTIATAPAQADCATAPVLETRQLTSTVRGPGGSDAGSVVVAKGGVVIRIGSAVITADEAAIQRGAEAKDPSDVELRGNVHLKSVLMAK